MTNTTLRLRNSVAAIACLLGLAGSAWAAPFSSGSTGADGAFAPTQNTTLELPPSGIFNFTTVNIPSGVTVSFKSNATNTPVMVLATGDVTIAGVLDVRGGDADVMREPAGSFLQQGALGGPGGYAGGRGGDATRAAAPGQGPGGGEGGASGNCYFGDHAKGGGGGGFAASGQASYCRRSYNDLGNRGAGGVAYGSSVMLPLVGGSGGGGGAGATSGTGLPGGGGGGGGGALLIASSGKVSLSGMISAQGGNGAYISGCSYKGNVYGGGGGGGSGGIVRILAQSYQASGTINVNGGAGGCWGSYYWGGGSGSLGYVNVETPRAGTLSLNGLPSLAITQVGGQAVPQSPTGVGDISLPLTQANPVQVDIAARFIPPGTAIKVVLTPTYSGDVVTVNASVLSGTLENSTSTASVNIPYGASTILVQASYTLTLAMGESLSKYAQGERVESILMSAAPGGATEFKLVTVSGKQFEIAPSVLAMVMPS